MTNVTDVVRVRPRQLHERLRWSSRCRPTWRRARTGWRCSRATCSATSAATRSASRSCPPGVTGIEDVTLFPNPTPGPCRLVFELSDPMAVQWDIYTLAGSRLRTLREEFTDGRARASCDWDGRDAEGDEIANGVYLYVLRGTGAAADGREITEDGPTRHHAM